MMKASGNSDIFTFLLAQPVILTKSRARVAASYGAFG
jgi:hypothetical protein